jgi:hypothetical protein
MNQAQYVATPKSPLARINVANPNLDGTGTIADLYPAGGAFRVDDIQIKAEVTTTAGMIRFYKHDGANYRLLHEEAVPVVAKSASVPAFEVTLKALEWIFQAGQKLAVSTEKGEAFVVQVTRGGDF